MKQRKTLRIISYSMIVIGLLILNYYMKQARQAESKEKTEAIVTEETEYQTEKAPALLSIDELTAEERVLAFVRENGQLPDYYINKKQARAAGWVASEGNLCDVLPGRAIGGDYFGNREKRLPDKKGRSWYEADLNYDCGRRNADRLLYSSDGLIYVSYDHYKTFQKR